MYQSPLLTATALPATVVAATNTTVIAAPGVGLRIRLVGAQFGLSRTATGVSDQALQDGVAGTTLARASGLSVGGVPDLYVPLPEPGITLTENTLLNLNHATTVVAGNVVCIVYYYIDQVA